MLTSKAPWLEYGKDPKTIMNIISTSAKPPKFPEILSIEC